MSNVVPEGLQDEDIESQQYCIWNPDFTTEDTYREVAFQYPSTRYQIGCACAASGYIDLYLLPEVAIAERALEGDTESDYRTCDMIMSSPVRYAVMDDYEHSQLEESTYVCPPTSMGKRTFNGNWNGDILLKRGPIRKFFPDKINFEEDYDIGLEESIRPDLI